jgi:GLPGLI family protein
VVYSITYDTYFKPFANNEVFDEYTRTFVFGDHSVYQSLNSMRSDSVTSKANFKYADAAKHFSYFNHHIKTNKDSLTYTETTGNQEFYYKEKNISNWKILDEWAKIGNYNCQKATIDYAGRTWIAWFDRSIPINAGPYKFKNLPGLIIKLEDQNGDYMFLAYLIQTTNRFYIDGQNPDKDLILKGFERLRQNDQVDLIKKTERKKHNVYKVNFYNLSLNEKLQLMNPNDINGTIKANNDYSFVSSKRKNKVQLNPIEIDHLD